MKETLDEMTERLMLQIEEEADRYRKERENFKYVLRGYLSVFPTATVAYIASAAQMDEKKLFNS